jgi:SAM-dependent methyltransferase
MIPPQVSLMCFACCHALKVQSQGKFACGVCGEAYEVKPTRLKTQADKHLFRMYRKDYLLNKVLNNNGFVSYSQLPDGSLSLSSRQDVARFRSFIQSQVAGGVVLDVGCGPLPLAGYLDFSDKSPYCFIGIDPIDGTSYDGFRIVGASELLPIQDATVDAVIFGTSLDHVCNLERSIRESKRVVRPDGRILVWMSDNSRSLIQRAKSWITDMVNSIRVGYPVRRYRVYSNFTVLEIPRGAVDPFHSYFESPEKIVRKFGRVGLHLVQREDHSRDEIFLSFALR